MNKLLLAAACCLPLRHLSPTSGYGYRIHPVTGLLRFHAGIDLHARDDTVFAVMPGHIGYVGYDPVTGVHIRLSSGDFSVLYGHLSQVFVLAGDSVNACTPLGITGSSGRVTGEHLHFSVSFRQAPVNPLLFLRGLTNNQLTNQGKTMSTPFKPLSEQISNKMIADLKAGTSIFQRPNNSLNSALPFNLESGHRYAGPSALILLMQKRDDPRWGTSNQANRNHTAVVKGAIGTLIQFMSNYEYQKMVDAQGEPVLKENGKQRTERIKLEEPKQVDAWLFNGEQMRNIQKWEKEPNILSPVERAQLILDNSKAVIEHGGDDMFYDRQLDAIIIPEQEHFGSPEQYYAEALHQLAHRENAQQALDRPQISNDPGGMVREELRTNLASLFMSKELNLPYELNEHAGYINSWALLMKEAPSELFQAASDAQQIVDKVLGYEQQIEEKQETNQDLQADNENETSLSAGSGIDKPKIDPAKLSENEVIPYNGTEFKVIKAQKKNVYQMQDLGSERKFKMSSKDELFGLLLDARNNSQEVSLDRGTSAEETAHRETEAVEQYLDEQYQIER